MTLKTSLKELKKQLSVEVKMNFAPLLIVALMSIAGTEGGGPVKVNSSILHLQSLILVQFEGVECKKVKYHISN